MRARSPLDYDVSVTADKRRRARSRGMSGAFETSSKTCDWPDCQHKGEYRAPYSPSQLNEFRWFCLDHVREYNSAWNFFADFSDEDLEAHWQKARVWERPTWRLGQAPKAPAGTQPHAEGRSWARWGFSDPFEVLGDNATQNPGTPANGERPRRRISREEQRALDTLGLPHQIETRREVRAQYRLLVKELHPDMNGGENPEPLRLERVLRAWQILKKSRIFPD